MMMILVPTKNNNNSNNHTGSTATQTTHSTHSVDYFSQTDTTQTATLSFGIMVESSDSGLAYQATISVVFPI